MTTDTPKHDILKRSDGGAVIMDGNRLRDEIIADIRAAIVKANQPKVCLATVLIGNNPASRIYVRQKRRKATEAGMISHHVELGDNASQIEAEAAVRELATDPNVHGILVQLPLPQGLDTSRILNPIPPAKDVDGLTPASLGRLVKGEAGHLPCTPLGVIRLLERYWIPTTGKRAVIIGRSILVGLPLVILLGRKGVDATPTLAHSRTRQLAELCRSADIVISAAGVAGLVTSDFLSAGATVIDVGISRVSKAIVGDVDFEACRNIAGAITPMPGGTGPMTIACLLQNTLEAAKKLGVL